MASRTTASADVSFLPSPAISESGQRQVELVTRRLDLIDGENLRRARPAAANAKRIINTRFRRESLSSFQTLQGRLSWYCPLESARVLIRLR